MRKFKLLIIFVILANAIAVNSQEIDKKIFKKYFQDAEYFFLFEDYEKAIPLYLKLYDMDSTNANINYRLGISYMQSPINKYKSIKYLEKASLDFTDNYKDGSYKERNAYFDVFSYLGDSYRNDFEFDLAIEAYEKYEILLDVDDLFELKEVENDLQICKDAKALLLESANNIVNLTQVELLNETINSEYPDYSPVVSGNDSVMFYTSRRRYDKVDIEKAETVYDVLDEFYMEDIYFSYRGKDGKWVSAEKVTKDIDADEYTSTVSLSYDGKRLYLMRKDILTGDEDEGNIYVSEYQNGNWSFMKRLNSNINSSKWETHASENADGTILYITSDREGGYGGLDIYQSTKELGGDWGPVQNLGNVINTGFDDEYPFILPNDSTLFFSSKGHYNIGGFDVFRAEKIGTNNWSVPINIGYPVNTVSDDIFYNPLEDGSLVYTSLLTREGLGDFDIYRMTVTKGESMVFGDEEVFSSLSDSGDVNLASLYKLNEKIAKSTEAKEMFEEAVEKEPTILETKEDIVLEADSVIETKKELIKVPEEKYITLKGTLKLADNNKLDKRFLIKVIDNRNENIIADILPNIQDGKYEAKLKSGEYKIVFSGEGYKENTKHIIVPKEYGRSVIVVDAELNLIEVEEGEYYVIKNIFFDYGKFDLKRLGMIELEKLNKLMTDNESLYIEVVGHTDSKSSAKFNQILSEKRSRSVINYLVDKGIDAQRFISKGVGEDEHVAINENVDGTDNEAGRALNRRVEIKILNSDNNRIIVERIDIPENLKYTSSARARQKNYTYTILLMSQKTKYTKESYLNYKERVAKDNKFYYTLGTFDKKAKAVKLLNTAIDAGFPDARIVSEDELEKLLGSKKGIETQSQVGTTQDNTTTPLVTGKVYTIQLKALIKPVDLGYFKDLKNVKEHLCKDGFYRYTYLEIDNYDQAKQELLKVLDLGYVGAFIVDESRYARVEEKGNEQYTIQLKALRNPINIGFFSSLPGVQEHISNDGFYKYTYGKYYKMVAAKKELKKVQKYYPDAFVVNLNKFK